MAVRQMDRQEWIHPAPDQNQDRVDQDGWRRPPDDEAKRYLFQCLDEWLRMRLRAMKYKRKSRNDNWRLREKHLRRMGCVFLSDCLSGTTMETSRRLPRGTRHRSRPVREIRTPVNRGN
jgi:hypothetical protein